MSSLGSPLPQYPYEERDRLQRGESLTRTAIQWAIILLVGIVVGGLVMQAFRGKEGEVPASLTAPPTITLATGPTVLNAIQQQAKLETIVMNLVQHIKVARQSGIGNICTQNVTFLAYFNVTAGTDLSRITTSNVVVTNDGYPDKAKVVITLPPAEIMHVEMDTKQSGVIAQESPTWIPGCADQSGEMVSEAQKRLSVNVERAALEQGILDKANEKAEFEVRRLLLSAGYKDVTVRHAASKSAGDLEATDVPPQPATPNGSTTQATPGTGVGNATAATAPSRPLPVLPPSVPQVRMVPTKSGISEALLKSKAARRTEPSGEGSSVPRSAKPIRAAKPTVAADPPRRVVTVTPKRNPKRVLVTERPSPPARKVARRSTNAEPRRRRAVSNSSATEATRSRRSSSSRRDGARENERTSSLSPYVL